MSKTSTETAEGQKADCSCWACQQIKANSPAGWINSPWFILVAAIVFCMAGALVIAATVITCIEK